MPSVGYRLPSETCQGARVDLLQNMAIHPDCKASVNARREMAGAHHVIDQERTVPILGERRSRVLDGEDVDDFSPNAPEDVTADHERYGNTSGPGKRAVQRTSQLNSCRRRNLGLPDLRNLARYPPSEDGFENQVDQRQGNQNREPGAGCVGENTPVKIWNSEFGIRNNRLLLSGSGYKVQGASPPTLP